MAQVLVTVEYEGEEAEIINFLDRFAEVVQDGTGYAPTFGLSVDGEPRDPDDPTSGLFD